MDHGKIMVNLLTWPALVIQLWMMVLTIKFGGSLRSVTCSDKPMWASVLTSPTLWQERRVLSAKSLNNPAKGCPRVHPNYSNRIFSPLFDSTVSNSDHRSGTSRILTLSVHFYLASHYDGDDFADNLKHVIVDHDVKHSRRTRRKNLSSTVTVNISPCLSDCLNHTIWLNVFTKVGRR